MAIFGKNKNNKNENAENENKAAENIAAEENEVETQTVTSASTKKYETPEGFDFNRYFLAERRIVLENVNYEVHPVQPNGQMKLNGKDTIIAQIAGQAGVKVTYNRTLKFEPDGPFTLSVSYAVMLIFNPGTRDELDWKTVDVAAQFRKHCAPICANISSRISLLIAEITSASGQPPMIIGMAPQQK